jgi:hypothetical protein
MTAAVVLLRLRSCGQVNARTTGRAELAVFGAVSTVCFSILRQVTAVARMSESEPLLGNARTNATWRHMAWLIRQAARCSLLNSDLTARNRSG